MNIFLIGAETKIGEILLSHLREQHEVKTHGTNLEGIDAIICAKYFEIDPQPDSGKLLSEATLETYQLCSNARSAGVKRIIVIANLNVYDTTPEKYMVDEMWRPDPKPDCQHLVPFLTSEVVREFCREGGMNGICLRAASIGNGDQQTSTADICEAVKLSLKLPFSESGYHWHVFHIPGAPRFLVRDAVKILGFKPKRK